MFKVSATLLIVLAISIFTSNCSEAGNSDGKDSTGSNSNAQLKIETLEQSKSVTVPPLPAMYVIDSLSQVWKKEFDNDVFKQGSKYSVLKAKTNVANRSFVFPQKAFADLIQKHLEITESSKDSIYVDFVTASKLPNRYLTLNIPRGKIMLLYSLSKTPGKRTASTYFFMKENSAAIYDLTAKEASTMRADFKENILNELAKTINLKHPDNLHMAIGEYSDTKSMQYQGGDFFQTFITEVQYQGGRSKDIKTIRVNLAAYTSNGNRPKNSTDTLRMYRNRLIILFDLMYKDQAGQMVSLKLESDENYNSRQTEIVRLKSRVDFDKGHLCPENCPDEDSDHFHNSNNSKP